MILDKFVIFNQKIWLDFTNLPEGGHDFEHKSIPCHRPHILLKNKDKLYSKQVLPCSIAHTKSFSILNGQRFNKNNY